MNLTVACKISLSKKLRKVVGDSCQLTLVADSIDKGTGGATLLLSSENDIEFDIEMGETSIQLTPESMKEEIPQSSSVGALFSTAPVPKNSAVSKMAATEAPSEGEESHAIVPEEEIVCPDEPTQMILEDQDYREYVSSLEELVEEANKMEMKEQEESIDKEAWIVNDKVGMLSLNDLEIDLPLNSPRSLNRVSAKRLSISRDLQGALNQGFIRFISPKEKDGMLTVEDVDTDIGEIGTFDRQEAERRMFIEDEDTPQEVDSEILDEKDLEAPFEEEGMILNLTQDLPAEKSAPMEGQKRVTSHGNQSRPSPQPPSKTGDSAIRPIRKI